MSHTDSTSPINTIIIKIILHTYLYFRKQYIHRAHVKYNAYGIFSVKHLYEHLAEKVYHIAT